ncbi:hypothetical protein [Metallosphaera sp.]|uniref:hypothetical protein n=1 Tax=Metallosphaera sp. TaxID=2020860 RepID=UPI00316BC398
MSNPKPENEEMPTYEKMLLRKLISNLNTMLLQLDDDTVFDNEVENLIVDLRYQLDRREDISDDSRSLINTMLNQALDFARDIGKSVDNAEELLADVKDEELDFAQIKLKFEAIYTEILDAMQSIWPVVITHQTLCSSFELCNGKLYNKVLDIHTKLENVAYEIFRYLTNL